MCIRDSAEAQREAGGAKACAEAGAKACAEAQREASSAGEEAKRIDREGDGYGKEARG